MRGTAYTFHIPSNSSDPYQCIFMERVRSEEADSSWASQEIPRISWNQCVHCTRQHTATDSYPQPINSIHVLLSHVFNTLFDFIPPHVCKKKKTLHISFSPMRDTCSPTSSLIGEEHMWRSALGTFSTILLLSSLYFYLPPSFRRALSV